MENHSRRSTVWRPVEFVCLAVAVVAAVGVGQRTGVAQEVPETFTATTANMHPEGTDLRINILNWSGDAEREAVIDVLTSAEAEAGGESDLEALLELPTHGSVWPGGSSLGYSVKYAHRATTADGGERLTFVTGRRLGKFGRDPWTPAGTPDGALRPFTVIEIRLDANGDGAGTMSPAADVAFDAATHTAGLVNYEDAPTLLEAAKRQPPPYWTQ